MAVVALGAPARQAGPLPPICLKTGVPTTNLVRVRGRAAPAWAGVTIVFGLVAWLFVSSASSRSYDLLVPFRAEVWQRHRKLRRAALATFWLGIVLAVVVGMVGGEQAWALLLLSLLGIAIGVVNDWRNSFGVRLGHEGGLELTRVHDDFAAAVRQSLPHP